MHAKNGTEAEQLVPTVLSSLGESIHREYAARRRSIELLRG